MLVSDFILHRDSDTIRSIVISSSLCFGFSLLTMYLRHTVIQALPMFCITSHLVVWSSFCHKTLHCTASKLPTFSALSNLHSIHVVCVLLTLIPLSSNAFPHNATYSVIINFITSIQDHIVCRCHSLWYLFPRFLCQYVHYHYE